MQVNQLDRYLSIVHIIIVGTGLRRGYIVKLKLWAPADSFIYKREVYQYICFLVQSLLVARMMLIASASAESLSELQQMPSCEA